MLLLLIANYSLYYEIIYMALKRKLFYLNSIYYYKPIILVGSFFTSSSNTF